MHRTTNQIRVALLVLGVSIVTVIGSRWVMLAADSIVPQGYPADTSLVVRIYYEEISDLSGLHGYDVWEYNNLRERYVLAAVDLAGYHTLINDGWHVAIDESASFPQSPDGNRRVDILDGYRTVDQLYAHLETLHAQYPSLTQIVDYGQSHCLAIGGCTTPGGDSLPGFPLRAIRITNEAVPGSSQVNGGTVAAGTKPVFFLMANIHAREITTPEIAMRLVDYLLDSYGNDADATWLVDHHEIWVVPTTNPDGRWFVDLGDTKKYGNFPFSQRKNANNDVDDNDVADCPVWPPASFEQFGIDLNRNHSFGWGDLGSSSMPCEMTFRGPAAASEIEVAALESLVKKLIPDQRGPDLIDPAPTDASGIFITLHSFSNLVLWPWGNSESPAPNMVDLKAIGDKLATFNGYLSCQPSTCLYLTSGSSDDWAYGELGIPAFTFEIGDQFMPPYSEIDDDQWPRNGPALIHAAKLARTPYETVHGPDVAEVVLTPQNSELTIRAIIDDQHNGGDHISAAVYSIDLPPWDSAAELISLVPADGAWDSARESVTGIVELSEISPGRHTIFIQGQDNAGNWGVVTAEFSDGKSATWTFEKSVSNHIVAPGGTLNYQINLTLNQEGTDNPYSLVISDILPSGVHLVTESIMVDGVSMPEIYDAASGKLIYEHQGEFSDSYGITIDYSVQVAGTTPSGQIISNQASAVVTLNSSDLVIPAREAHTLVLTIVDEAFAPLILAP